MKNKSNEEHRYDDIINLSYPGSTTRPRMSMIDRAAQFSPFAALTGYEAAIKETARLTDQKIEVNEDEIAFLREKMRILQERLPECPEIQITYFVPDEKKDGGTYRKKTGQVKKIDEYERLIIMCDHVKIAIDEIVSIEGSIFDVDVSI